MLAFYALVIGMISNAVKSIFRGTRYRIAIDEMPDTRDVVDLLEGVYIARRELDFDQETLLQERDGYRQKSRLNCFAPRSLYVMYCSLALYPSAGDRRAALPKPGETHAPHELHPRAQRTLGRVMDPALLACACVEG